MISKFFVLLVTGSMYFGIIFRPMLYLKDIYKTLKGTGKSGLRLHLELLI